jgi:hypothetical protein
LIITQRKQNKEDFEDQKTPHKKKFQDLNSRGEFNYEAEGQYLKLAGKL